VYEAPLQPYDSYGDGAGGAGGGEGGSGGEAPLQSYDGGDGVLFASEVDY
jgi:hypothetical protein